MPQEKSLNSRYSILPLGDDDSDDDNSLYYNSADLTSDDPKDAVDQNQLEPLLAEIIANADNLTELDKCQRYRSQISDICLAKFVQRTRVRPEEVRQASGTESPTPVDDGKPARPSFNLASPQQICCEFRMTYMRCLLANVNQVCPLTEFNLFTTKCKASARSARVSLPSPAKSVASAFASVQ